MKPSQKAIYFSLLIHLGLLAILLVLHTHETKRTEYVLTEFITYSPPQEPIPELKDTRQPFEQNDLNKPIPVIPQVVPGQFTEAEPPEDQIAIAPDSSYPNYTYTDILKENTVEQQLQAIRRLILYNTPLPDSLFAPSDSALLQYRLAIYGSHLDDYAAPLGEDRITSQLYQENTGHSPLVNIGGLIAAVISSVPGKSKQNKKVKPRITSEPTRLELDLLNTLWAKGPSLQLDLYRNMDTSIPITAFDLSRVLDNMTLKGYLKRKKVSPENLLTVITPIGVQTFEQNELNRLNPIYQYTNVITKKDVLQYLDILLYDIKNKMSEYTTLVDADSIHLKNLKEKILLLLGQYQIEKENN